MAQIQARRPIQTLLKGAVMTEEATNALKALARLPIPVSWSDDVVVFEFEGNQVTAGHVRDASNALALQSKER